VSLGGPPIYPGVLSWLGIARELTAGTPLAPTYTQPLEQNSFEPEDTPKFLKDNAIRGAMTDLFYETLGVESGTFSFGGPNFLDTHGYFFDNVFGDLSTTGSSPANPSTTSGVLPVGSTNMTLASAPPTQYTAGAAIQIGTAPTAEVVVISTTAASNVVNFINYPLRFTHPTAQTVNTCTTPFTHKWAALNSQLGYGGAFGAQPPTHTFTDVTNIVNTFTNATYGTAPSNTYGARQYASACLKNLDFSGNAEQLLGIKMTGDTWLSQVAGTVPVNTVTGARPIPNWNSQVLLLGSTVPTNVIGEFMVSFKRATQVYWTVQGTQTPYVIARGPLNVDGTIQWDPTNTEEPLDLMLLNAQGPMSITVSNQTPNVIPNSGPPFTLTITMTQVANIKSKIMRSKQLIGYSNSFEGVSNSTDVGGSGGLGPGTITLVNSIPAY